LSSPTSKLSGERTVKSCEIEEREREIAEWLSSTAVDEKLNKKPYINTLFRNTSIAHFTPLIRPQGAEKMKPKTVQVFKFPSFPHVPLYTVLNYGLGKYFVTV
jgi:hypothetical protein